jgi:2-methoxy-6-polyprenyl-1,4-benzoquinol methylase
MWLCTFFLSGSMLLGRTLRCSSLGAAKRRILIARKYSQQQSQDPAFQNPQSQGTTSFGFETVGEEEKEPLVKNVFDSVASSYDLMNDAMSLGVHRLWKDNFVSSLKPGRRGAMKCIDVAGGTGDIALRILDHARETYADRETTVDVVDINAKMLKAGLRRFKKTMYHNSQSLRLDCGSWSGANNSLSASDIVPRGQCSSTARRALQFRHL